MGAVNGGGRMMKSAEEVMSSIKRRKVDDSDIGDHLQKDLLLASGLLADSMENYSATSLIVIKGDLCSDYVKSTDLKRLQGGEDSETVASTSLSGELFRETSPSSSGEEDSEEAMDSSSSTKTKTKTKSSSRKCCVVKMPSTAEIDEFFSVAEKSEQEQFAKKYNYDIVNDVPMKGQYKWIPLKDF